MTKKNEKDMNAANASPDTAAKERQGETEIPESVTLTREEFLKVKERIEALESEKAENVALLQRLQADFDNYRKRNANLACECVDEGARNLIKGLLPVLDDLDRALDAVPEGRDAEWVSGVRLIHTKLLDILAKNGMEEIDASGSFDPDFHHAVLQEEAEGKENGDIVEVLQKGYKVKDRIIRHTMVKVAK